MDRCVEDIMKEKNINPEKDDRFVFTVFSFIMCLHPVRLKITQSCETLEVKGL